MRIVLIILLAITSAWTLVSLAAIAATRVWYREREGRGGPIPVSQAAGLTLPIRGLLDSPRRILDSFGLKSNQTVLEIGPGPGYFTPDAARMVEARGRVLSVELQPGMLALLQQRLRERLIANVDPIAADATRLPLSDHSVDVAFLAAVFGEVPDRPGALAELRRVLKPGATLAFFETMRDSDYVYVDTMKELCRAYGFLLVEHRRRFLGYTMTFTAPAAAVP
ncbi:MAG TPA: class I SAM-dependent methyltransferase [Dehalococcoidia bacterium]